MPECPLLGVQRTSIGGARMSANSHKRTLQLVKLMLEATARGVAGIIVKGIGAPHTKITIAPWER